MACPTQHLQASACEASSRFHPGFGIATRVRSRAMAVRVAPVRTRNIKFNCAVKGHAYPT